MLERYNQLEGRIENLEPVLQSAAGQQFYNVSPLTVGALLNDPPNIADNLRAYIGGFSSAAKDILEKFEFDVQISRLDKADLLYQVIGKFAAVDLHPENVSNIEMGYLYEELIRRFSELSNETAGEHFTPREVIRLMVNLLFIEDEDVLTTPGIVKSLYDPACGTGGMLSVAEDALRLMNPQARLEVFGQELNPETYAICRSDMMLKGKNAANIYFGNSFDRDGLPDSKFDYMLANPPFGVEWKKVEGAVRREAETRGFDGRFGAGLPRINDGSFLFLQHMLSKMKPSQQGGCRLAIVFNGSPLFTGGAGSGESEIRRWIIENDWLEAVVALPDQLFYNTGISTYFWILTNRKSPERRGKVQLIDARELYVKMRKSLGEKRKEISREQIEVITRLYGEFVEGDQVKVFPKEAFGFMRITVERPLRLRWEVSEETVAAAAEHKAITRFDGRWAEIKSVLRTHLGARGQTDAELFRQLRPDLMLLGLPVSAEKALREALAVRDPMAPAVTDRRGNPEPDPDLRDYENVPLPPIGVTYESNPSSRLANLPYVTAINDYVAADVLPYVPDAWVDLDRTKVGYEIPLIRHFYKYVSPRPLEEIDAELKSLEAEAERLLAEVTK